MSDRIDHVRTAACGLLVSHVWRGHGSALFVELGELTPRARRDGTAGQPEGEIGLMIEWSWRIVDGTSIASGSWSDEALWAPTATRLVGRVVEDLKVFGRLPEVMLSQPHGRSLSISNPRSHERRRPCGAAAFRVASRRGPTRSAQPHEKARQAVELAGE